MSPVVATALLIVIVTLLASLFLVNTMGVTAEINMGAAGAGGGDVQSRGVIMAVDDDPMETAAHHRVEFPVKDGSNLDGDSLNSVSVEYLDDSVSVNAEEEDVEKVGIDEDGDGSIETNATGDVQSVDTGGDTVDIGLSGNYNLEGGDVIIVVYSGVTNPAYGLYPGAATVNDYRKIERLGTIYIVE